MSKINPLNWKEFEKKEDKRKSKRLKRKMKRKEINKKKRNIKYETLCTKTKN